jgi:site-specific recombinase XerD
VDLLKFWIHEGGRDRFPTADRSAALWPSERADRIMLGRLGDSFAAARDAVGLPKELGLHCLRHSYITHLIEAGYDPAFVQTQAGHTPTPRSPASTHRSVRTSSRRRSRR